MVAPCRTDSIKPLPSSTVAGGWGLIEILLTAQSVRCTRSDPACPAGCSGTPRRGRCTNRQGYKSDVVAVVERGVDSRSASHSRAAYRISNPSSRRTKLPVLLGHFMETLAYTRPFASQENCEVAYVPNDFSCLPKDGDDGRNYGTTDKGVENGWIYVEDDDRRGTLVQLTPIPSAAPGESVLVKLSASRTPEPRLPALGRRAVSKNQRLLVRLSLSERRVLLRAHALGKVNRISLLTIGLHTRQVRCAWFVEVRKWCRSAK